MRSIWRNRNKVGARINRDNVSFQVVVFTAITEMQNDKKLALGYVIKTI